MSHPQNPQPRPGPSPGEPAPPQLQQVAYRLPLYRPVATWVLLALIAVVFAIETVLGGSTDADVLLQMGAKSAPDIAAGEYWRLLTSMFLHIGVMHLALNGYALFIIGTELERILGPSRFLTIYLFSGLFGSLASYALSDSLAAGASGAIFGLIGALAAFFLVYRERLGSWGTRRLVNIAVVLIINLVWGFSQPGIDNLAHLGGLVAGAALGWALTPRYEADWVRGQVRDRNRLGRYWPALVLAALLLVGGTALSTALYRDSPRSHLDLAQEALDADKWDEAATELEQAIALDPSLATASDYFRLGLARHYLEQPEAAVAAYEKAVELEPDQPATHLGLALAYLEMERYADARASFEAYAELTPAGPVQVRPYLDELESLGY